MGVQWFGQTLEWKQVPQCLNPTVAMALTEDAVLQVATMQTNLKRLSVQAALNCTSRFAQRTALEPTGFNPNWKPVPWATGVLKAPASASSYGVWFLQTNRFVEKLKEVAPELAETGVLEEEVFGIHFEQDGFICEDEIYFFHPLLQHWNQDKDCIQAYERAEAPGIREAASACVRALGLNHSCFCVELVRTADRWYVIEVNARLGYDDGLPELLCDENPLQLVNRFYL